MRSTAIKSSFNTGEVSELMNGRIADFDKMKSAMVTSLNGIPRVEGPWTRRPGSGFCDEVRFSLKKTRVVRFKYSTVQAYVLEFGDQYVRVKKNRAPIYSNGLSVTAITQANPGVVTYTGTDPANGDDVDMSLVVGMTEVNGRRFRVHNVNAGLKTFELYELSDNPVGSPVDTTSYAPYVSGGAALRVFTLATPYAEADVFALTFATSGDKLYIFHPDYPEATLNRFADNNWTYTPITFFDGPYLPQNKTTVTMTLSSAAVGAGRTLTASSITALNDGSGFLPTDVGRYVRFKATTAAWGYMLITGFTSSTQVTVTIINAPGGVGATTTWRMGLLSATTGYSAAGTFFSSRLVIGGCPYREARWDASYVDDYSNFAETEVDGSVTDSNAIAYTLTSEESQAIQWMRATPNGFVVGTREGEWLARPSVIEEAMTPTNRDAKQSADYGNEPVQAIRVGATILAIRKYARRLSEIVYSFYENRLLVTDATVLAEHIAKGTSETLSGFVEVAYQKERIPVVWAPRKDGVLLGMTYDQDEKVQAWHRHQYGGYSDAAQTQPAVVESVCVVPAFDASYEELWTVTRRWIHGRQVRYTEYLNKTWEKSDDPELPRFLDCALEYNGTPTMAITGLYHLRGETVSVVVNGAVHPDVVVDELGRITLKFSVTSPTLKVIVGYNYFSDGQILPFDSGSADGTAQGKLQRKHHVAFRLYQSLGLSVGQSFNKLTRLAFRKSTDGANTRTPLFSGIKLVDGWPGDYSNEDGLCWRFDQPLPGTVSGIIARGDTSDA